MALDGAFLACLRQELTEQLTEARIDKIHQPGREELILALRWRGGARRLYLNAGADDGKSGQRADNDGIGKALEDTVHTLLDRARSFSSRVRDRSGAKTGFVGERGTA